MNFEKKSNDNSYFTAANMENNAYYRNSKAEISNQLQQFFTKKLDLIYQTPPNDRDAQIHKKASAFGFHATKQKGQFSYSVCPCCQYPINTIPLPISISTTPLTGPQGQAEFFPLDSGTSMFFTFIKMVIFYLGLLFIVSNIYPLHLGYLANNFCRLYPDQCGNSWFIKFSPAKFVRIEYSNTYYIMNYMNLIMIVGSIVFFIIFRKYQYHIYGIIDLHNLTQDDFTILVKNIPLKIDSNFGSGVFNIECALRQLFEQKIKNFLFQVKNEKYIYSQHSSLQNMIPQMQIPPQDMQKIKSISLCFDLNELEDLISQRERLVMYYSNNKKENVEYQKINAQQLSISQINKKQLQLCKSFRYKQQNQLAQSKFIGKAFVSFQFQHYRDFILHLYQNNPNQLTINGQKIKVKKATNPSDILWLNLNINRTQRVIRIIISYIAMILVLTISFLLIMAIFNGGQTPDQNSLNKNTIGLGKTILIALIIYFLQFILGLIAQISTIRERHETKTKQTISLVIKIVVIQFVTNAIIYFVLNIIQGYHFLLDTGLVVQMSNFTIISGLLSLPLNFFQISSKVQSLFKKLKFCLCNNNKLLQFQYNNITQLPQFDFADRYCYYLTHNFTLVFYSYINPICVPIFIAIAICHYWIDKYNLFRYSSNKFPMNFAISRVILKMFQLSIVIFAIGNYYFGLKLSEQFSLINLIGLMIAIGYSLLAVFSPAFIEQKIFGNPHQIETISYTRSLNGGSFKQTYWGCNPATMLIPQHDINRSNYFVNYSSKMKIAQISDFDDNKRES